MGVPARCVFVSFANFGFTRRRFFSPLLLLCVFSLSVFSAKTRAGGRPRRACVATKIDRSASARPSPAIAPLHHSCSRASRETRARGTRRLHYRRFPHRRRGARSARCTPRHTHSTSAFRVMDEADSGRWARFGCAPLWCTLESILNHFTDDRSMMSSWAPRGRRSSGIASSHVPS